MDHDWQSKFKEFEWQRRHLPENIHPFMFKSMEVDPTGQPVFQHHPPFHPHEMIPPFAYGPSQGFMHPLGGHPVASMTVPPQPMVFQPPSIMPPRFFPTVNRDPHQVSSSPLPEEKKVADKPPTTSNTQNAPTKRPTKKKVKKPSKYTSTSRKKKPTVIRLPPFKDSNPVSDKNSEIKQNERKFYLSPATLDLQVHSVTIPRMALGVKDTSKTHISSEEVFTGSQRIEKEHKNLMDDSSISCKDGSRSKSNLETLQPVVGSASLHLKLHRACQKNCVALVIEFLEQGADINYPVSDGEPAWVSLVKSGFNVLLEILLNSGFNPNVQDAHGNTPLHWAVMKNMPILVDTLMYHGADPTIKNAEMKSAQEVSEASSEITLPNTAKTCHAFFQQQHVCAQLNKIWTHAQIIDIITPTGDESLKYRVRFLSVDTVQLLPETSINKLSITSCKDVAAFVPFGAAAHPSCEQVSSFPLPPSSRRHSTLRVVSFNNQIPQLPAKLTVKTVLQRSIKGRTSSNRDTEVAFACIQTLFRMLLPRRLLYEHERGSYEALLRANPLGFDVCDVYGVRHLIRLCVLMPELLYACNCTPDQMPEVVSCLHHLVQYMTNQLPFHILADITNNERVERVA